MRRQLTILMFFLSLGYSSGQFKVDSIINSLNGKNIPVLNRQLYAVIDHRLLDMIEPDHSKWPELLNSISSRVIEKSKTFDESGRTVALAHMAEVLVRENRSGLGYNYIQQALDRSKKLKGPPVVYTYYKYAAIFQLLNRLDSAVYYAEKSLNEAQETKSDSTVKQSLDQVALLCYKTKNFSKSEYYLKKLITSPFSQTNQKRDYLNTLALTFRKRQMYDSALFYFKQSLDYSTALKDSSWIGLVQGNIGYCYFLQGKYESSLPGLFVDVYCGFRKRNRESALNALTTVVNVYLIQGKMDKAKIYYDSLAHNIQKTSSSDVRLEFYKTSADYFEKQGNLGKSVTYLKKYLTLDDSLNQIQNNSQAAQLEAQFEFDRQVRQIRDLEMRSEAQAKENTLKNYFLIATLIIIILGIVLMYVQYRNNAFKNSTNQILAQQAQHLNELNATKDKLFAIIGHDMRGPINSLKGLLTLVKNQMISKEEFESFSSDLLTNVDRVHFTLNNLLQWSSSQLKGMKTKAGLISIKEVVNENFDLLTDQATVKNLKLINLIDDSKKVLSDPDHLRLVFRNLISNAIKFTNPGGSITVSSFSKDGKEIISVTDTGVGMTEHEKNLMFSPTNRHSTTGTEGERGTGLGVQLCKEMIEKNGGKIWVESKKGQGTSMKFSLSTSANVNENSDLATVEKETEPNELLGSN